VGISDDLHGESAELHLGQACPQAIIGACDARVERILPPIRPGPEPPVDTAATRYEPKQPIQNKPRFPCTLRHVRPSVRAEGEKKARARRAGISADQL